MDETGARINIPPPSMMKNDISVAGDKDSVAKAVAQVKKIWGEMVRMLLLLSFECLVFSLHSPSPPSPLLFFSLHLLSPCSLVSFALSFSVSLLPSPSLSLVFPLYSSLTTSPSPPLWLLSFLPIYLSSLLSSLLLPVLHFSFPHSSLLLSLFLSLLLSFLLFSSLSPLSFSFLLSLAEENMLHCVCRGAQKPTQVHHRSPRTRTAGDTPDHRLAKHQHYLYSLHVCICLQ